MGAETARLLEAFEALPSGEKRFFTQEVLRRALPFDSGPLDDEELAGAADGLFSFLSEEENAAGARWVIPPSQAGGGRDGTTGL